MDFQPQNFRHVDQLEFKIRTADATTLILVKADGWCMYGRTRADKDTIVEKFEFDKDLLLWAWPGEYRTDIFQLSHDDLKKYYR
jgi:hypothetical protein